ncbi:hypothetical protein J848_4291, partial [Acinetobacter baumannii 24975_5]
MCGRPAVPNMSAKPRDKASIGFEAAGAFGQEN